jgi:hypothetical protein
MKTQIVPAEPKWNTVDTIIKGGKVCGLHLEPIIAWAIQYKDQGEDGPSAEPLPITCEGIDSTGPGILRRPDGRFFQPYMHEFQNEGDVIAYLDKKYSRPAGRTHQ